jgi:formylglycine-generating enzyme required for sulfatase activity
LKPQPLTALILAASLGAAPAALLAASPDAAHHQVSQPAKACAACHSGTTEQKLRVAANCGECHDFGPKQGSTLRVAAPLDAEPELPAAFPGKGPGMRVPLYYPGTRIGPKPNPMVLVPAGPFLMGSNTRLPDEGPQHTVTLKAFYIDKYEVTNLQYKQFIAATKRKSPEHFTNRTFPEGKADHPVTFVSWEDAHDYCAWAGKRLPSDEEWEKAARGTDGRTFPWGNEFELHKANTPVRWKNLKQEGDTAPVGAFAGGASPYGAYDMSGNVWEWTDSWYKAYPGNKKPSENYGEHYKTLKGGSWWDCSFYQCGISAPVFNRAFFDLKVKNASFGFRCAKDAK